MNAPEHDFWPASPWIGKGGSAQLTLWAAGNEWSTLTGWFSSPVVAQPPANPTEPQVAERPTDLIICE